MVLLGSLFHLKCCSQGLSYIFGPYLSYINWELGNDVDDTIRFLTDVIIQEAAAYRARTRKTFVLILDDIEKMLDQVNGIADLHELHFMLKIISDSLVMHVVLVESSGWRGDFTIG